MPNSSTRTVDVYRHWPEGYAAMRALSETVSGCGLDPVLLALVRLRASQMNGCSFCIDLHWKEAREAGVAERRLAALLGWRGTRMFDERETAVLRLTESLTVIADEETRSLALASALGCMSELEVSQALFAIAVINAWNRLSVGSGNVIG